MSAFVWLDYSERERRKMLDVVDLFREHDTRDELGVGSVRDAFADMLFPGTSTIMTRARYFLLVPWAYQRLERLHVRSAEIAARARQAELNLVEPIERSDDNDGNIGKVAKTTLILEALLHKGPMPVNAIGPKVDLNPGSVSVAVDRLYKKGFVSRVESNHDDESEPSL